MPRWSPDGARIAFVRRPAPGGAPDPWLEQTPYALGDPGGGRPLRARAGAVWSSPNTLHGSYPTTEGQANLHWGAGDRIVFLADMDGWEHLYSVPVAGGEPHAAHAPRTAWPSTSRMSPDGRDLVWAGNMGDGPDDIERRHVFRVGVDGSGFANVTPGDGQRVDAGGHGRRRAGSPTWAAAPGARPSPTRSPSAGGDGRRHRRGSRPRGLPHQRRW